MARPRKELEQLTERINVRFTPSDMEAFQNAFPGVRQGGTADIIRELVEKAVSVAPQVQAGTLTPEEAARVFESFFRGIAVTQAYLPGEEPKPSTDNNASGKGV